MNLRAALVGCLALLLAGCASLPAPTVSTAPRWPDVKIVAFTDPHLYNPDLGTSGLAWNALASGFYQVVQDSPEIVRTLVAQLVADPPQLVLITGDLTKDGERASHELMASLLAPLRTAGIPVLVVPGNHDIANPAASGYRGLSPTPVASVTADEFAQIYRDFGWGSALSRDPASLSYLAEPVPRLRILALDTCRYEDNPGRAWAVTPGRIRSASWPWITRVLSDSAREGIPVMVMMHHALVEKFPGQARLFRDYVVADQAEVQSRLAALGVQVALTGHFHSLSTAASTIGGRILLDIEDGTLAQFPLGYRRLTVHNNRLQMTTDHVTDLPSWSDRPGAFVAHARQVAESGTSQRVGWMVRRFGASPEEAGLLSAQFAPAYLSLIQGNPQEPASWIWPPRGLGLVGTLAVAYLGDVPENLWKSLPPDDLTLDWDLSPSLVP